MIKILRKIFGGKHMQSSEFLLNKTVNVEVAEGKIVQGTLKGISEDYNGKVTATVEYLTPVRNAFELEKIS